MCRRPVIPWMRRDLLGAAFLSGKKGRHSMSASSLRLEEVCLLSAVSCGYWTCSNQTLKYRCKFYGEISSCSGDKIEKNEMGKACSAYGGEERCIQGFGGET